jgi:hypothetical protein
VVIFAFLLPDNHIAIGLSNPYVSVKLKGKAYHQKQKTTVLNGTLKRSAPDRNLFFDNLLILDQVF